MTLEKAYAVYQSGTDIRGVACEGVAGEPVNLTDDKIMQFADGFLLWLCDKTGKKADTLTVAVGHDSRISAERIQNAVVSRLVRAGVRVLLCGLASTPSMFQTTVEIGTDGAVQITASHHPFHRNGLKFFTRDGGLDTPDIRTILLHAQNGDQPQACDGGTAQPCDFMQQYAALLRNKILEEVIDQKDGKPLQGLHLVVDAGNGAGGFYATEVLQKLGADISGSQFLEPDGRFPNHIPNPENEEAMRSVSEATVRAGADLGIIFDTDVDRAGCVGPDGKEINRNRLIALAATIALNGRKGGVIVTDSTTSDGLHDFLQDTLGAVHHRFKRGYKNVINEAVRLCAEGKDCPLAIETSGHAALRENYFLDDGAYLMTKIVITLVNLRAQGKALEDCLAALKEPAEAVEKRYAITEPDFRTYGQQVLTALEQYAATQPDWVVAPDNHDGIRISVAGGWFLLRLSVHDPILPLNAESETPGGTARIIAEVEEFLHGFEKLTFPN